MNELIHRKTAPQGGRSRKTADLTSDPRAARRMGTGTHGWPKAPLVLKMKTSISIVVALCLLLATATVAQVPSPNAAPAAGVYGCYSARPTFGGPGCVPSSVGCMGMKTDVAPTVMFGLIDGSTYSDYDGKKGHYTFDATNQVLTMTDGSRKGWRYKRVAATAFRFLDEQGKERRHTRALWSPRRTHSSTRGNRRGLKSFARQVS